MQSPFNASWQHLAFILISLFSTNTHAQSPLMAATGAAATPESGTDSSGLSADPAKSNRSSTTPNVVLGRDLISATKASEDLQLRLGLLTNAKGVLERIRAELIGRNRQLSSDLKVIEALRIELDAIEKQGRTLNSGVKGTIEAGAASQPKGPPLPPDNLPRPRQPRQTESELTPELEYDLNSMITDLNSVDHKLTQILNRLKLMEISNSITNDRVPQVQFLLDLAQRAVISTGQPAFGAFGAQMAPPLSPPFSQELLLSSLSKALQSEPVIEPTLPSTDGDSTAEKLVAVQGRVRASIKKLDEVEAEREARLEYLNLMEDTTKGLDTSITNLSKQLDDELKVALKSKTSFEATLGDRDQEISQSRINLWLVGAVFVMVLVIFLLLVPLSYFSTSVSEFIIESRVFVEVLSMSFLLLTVIILGTGRLVSGEGLAGLLGTIAGYIFARKTAELNQQGPLSTRPLRKILNETLDAELELERIKAEIATLESAENSDDKNRKLNEARAKEIATTQKVQQLRTLLATEAKRPAAGNPANPTQ